MKKKFPLYRQLDTMDCGPACLRMVARYYGKSYTLERLRELSYITREGVSLAGISEAAETIGFRTLSVQIGLDALKEDVPLPAILYWRERHFIVVYKLSKSHVFIADPAYGYLKLTHDEFLDGWSDTKSGTGEGICLLLEPSPDFSDADDEGPKKKRNISIVLTYLKPYKKLMLQLAFGLLASSAIQLILPFLTQSIVDTGIFNSDLSFINLVLAAQLMLFVGRSSAEFFRNRILMHLGSRINIVMVSDFLAKLMRLPISFFDIKMAGDIIQRVHDHERIENLLTSSTLSTLFSAINLMVFALVLFYFNSSIFWVFIAGSVLYTVWVVMFLGKRRELDYKNFDKSAASQNNLMQLIYGMQEIKLNNSELMHRWKWEKIQAGKFKLGVKSLALQQYQDMGSGFINEAKNIFITFMAAKSVLAGSMTLGMMLAVQYIIGQLNAPIVQLVGFIRSYQDARLSLERISEIHEKEDEVSTANPGTLLLPAVSTISLNNVGFGYEGSQSGHVLHNICMHIPQGRVTAIVGPSGSGKTTLLKLLLRFYAPTQGEIKIGSLSMQHVHIRSWRQKCGTVMQDGYIFSDTIARNIAASDEKTDTAKLLHAAGLANIREFIESLPLGFNTKIGLDGHGLSQGQKQRILIARAIYKNPEFLFFDEATNALDAHNEKIIMNNLNKFFKGKTVVIVAHRLSTVKNADQIIVLDKGRIIETGNHAELTMKQGPYFELVRNQLELGK